MLLCPRNRALIFELKSIESKISENERKMSKPTEADAIMAVTNYLQSTNRPYSLNDIVNNLQNKFGKTAITKALDSLIASNTIHERLNGKQKIYFFAQENIEIDNQKLKELDDRTTALEKEIETAKEAVAIKQQKIRSLNELEPIEQIEKRLQCTKDEVAALQAKLKEIDSRCQNIDPEIHSKVKEEHQTLICEWRKRKRLATQVIDTILEGYPKSKKIFLEEVGIETDEYVNVVMPS